MPEALRRLTLDDLRPQSGDAVAGPLALSALAGWNQTAADWRRLLLDSPDGCFGIACDGNIVGTVTTTRYGQQLGWIGMMLVHPDYRRRGLATRLMQAAIDHLRDQDVATIRLDATPQGRPLYERLGFRLDHSWTRTSSEPAVALPGDGRSDERTALQEMEVDRTERNPDDQPALSESLLAADRLALGADRSAMLRRLAADSKLACHSNGYAMLRPGRTAWYLGPVMATDTEVAISLIRRLLASQPGPFLWDVPGDNPSAANMAQTLGFSPIRTLYRMSLDDTPPRVFAANQPDRLFAIADPALG
ncbi:MAG: GNAT family N-acetyltransferase [Planctomycetaceae bacterium]|nr:MAG: GNAT family N-acetyltransferase [Planctomycetaceae bacterium]